MPFDGKQLTDGSILAAKMASPAGASTGVWVDPTGNDATGLRGDPSLRFATIQAALDAALDGDTVYIGAGTYTEDVVMPDLNRITIIGAGQNSTFLTNATVADTFFWGPTTYDIDRFTMRDLTIINKSATKRCLVLDGSVNSSTTIAVASNGAAITSATINVLDTTFFAASGRFQTTTTAGISIVDYTGKTGTSFTGCTLVSGGGTLSTGNAVYTPTFTFGGTIFELERLACLKSVSTTIAVASNGATLPTGTINVADTTGFPAAGVITVVTSSGPQTVTYTGVGATTFTGCTGGTGTMSTGGAVTGVPTGAAVYMRRVARVNTDLCTWTGNSTTTTTLTNTNLTARASILSAMDCEYIDTQPISTAVGREGVYLAGGSTVAPLGVVTLRAHVLFGIDSSCIIYGSVSGATLSTFSGPTHGPVIVLQGVVGSPLIPGSGGISLTLPTNVGSTFIDLSRGQFFANSSFGSTITITGSGAGTRNVVGAIGARFAATGASSVVAGTHVDLNARGATFAPQTIFGVAGTGTIDRDRHVIVGIATIIGTVAVSITPPFPTAGGTSYTVSITPRAAAIVPFLASAPAISSTSFSVTGAAVGTVDAVVSKFA